MKTMAAVLRFFLLCVAMVAIPYCMVVLTYIGFREHPNITWFGLLCGLVLLAFVLGVNFGKYQIEKRSKRVLEQVLARAAASKNN